MKPQGWAGLFAVVLVCTAVVWFGLLQGRWPGGHFLGSSTPPAESGTAPKATSGTQAPATPSQMATTDPVPSANSAPRFDIVRVEPDGSAVVAGRAAPGSKIELLRNKVVFAETQANQEGQWVVTPPAFPKGSMELTLRSTNGGACSTST